MNNQTNHHGEILTALRSAEELLSSFLKLPENIEKISAFSHLAADTLKNGGKIITCGNGGSMCDAMHLAEELSGRFKADRKPLAAIALSDPAHLSCVANDYGYAEVFARSVEALATSKDLIVGLSTSGNSPNIIAAFQKARAMGAKRIALLGNDGGKLGREADLAIIIASDDTARIQEMHIKIIHITISVIERILQLV